MNLKKRLMKFFRKNDYISEFDEVFEEIEQEIKHSQDQKRKFQSKGNSMTYEEAQAKIKKFIELHKDKNILDVIPNINLKGKVSDLVVDGDGDWKIPGEGFAFYANSPRVKKYGNIALNSTNSSRDTTFNIDDYLVEVDYPYVDDCSVPLLKRDYFVDGTNDYYVCVDMSKPMCFNHHVKMWLMNTTARRSEMVNVIGWSTESVWVQPMWSTVCRIDKSNVKLYRRCPKKPEQIPVITEYTMDELTKKLGHNFKIVK